MACLRLLSLRSALQHCVGAVLVMALLGMAVCAQARTVRVGVYQNEPKIFADTQGQPSGILGDLLVEIARAEQWTLQPVACEWQACLDALERGELDLMPDVAYTEARDQVFDFHKVPSLLSWSQIYKHRGLAIYSALDLQGKRLAVLDGSVQQTYLRNLLQGFGVQATLVAVQSLREGFEMADAGRVDAVAANRFFGDLQAPTYRLESTPIMFLPSQLFFATTQGRNADLLGTIDTYLQRWGAQPDSQYFVIQRRWMATPPQFLVPMVVWWSLAGLAVLLVLAVAVGLFLRREVARKTASLRASEDKLATILNSVDAFIYIKDMDLRYQYVNRKVAQLFGTEPEQVVGKTDAEFFDAATVAKLQQNDQRVVLGGERVEEEEINRAADGHSTRTYWSVKLPLQDDAGRIYGLCGISTDVTKHKQAEEAIHRLAYYDPLTQLPNRRLLLERMQAALLAHARNQQCGALLFIDVDNFKDLNDTMGHHVGDQLLRQMAARLGTCVRAQDTISRQGGDEFVVMLQDLSVSMEDSMQQARKVADKIRQRLDEPYWLEGKEYKSSVSIGVTLFAGQALDVDELLKQADLAMYQAKAEGRNAVRFFDPYMQTQVSERIALETALREGLQASQFVLHYQPQVRSDGSRIGMEALVRWNHPERGLVPPGQFIGVAEACGLILPLGAWILQEACAQLVRWSAQPEASRWTVAVNVSAKQFQQSDFVQTVQDALQASGANAQLLELELTESLLVDDVDAVVDKMVSLKALGVRLSLDDFGTGYSSLSMLKRLPLDQLKIDQSFVRDLLVDAQDASIVRAIVTLGESLQLDVIAEGVETQAQRDALLALGCRKFQGYYLGHPAPAPYPASPT